MFLPACGDANAVFGSMPCHDDRCGRRNCLPLHVQRPVDALGFLIYILVHVLDVAVTCLPTGPGTPNLGWLLVIGW
jgi:hypothetical protein